VSVQLQVFETVLAFALVVALVHLLKRFGVVSEDQGPMFARLLTQGILPAAIFHQLLTHPVSLHQFVPVAIMALTGVASLAVAWAAGRLLRFDRPTIGAVMLTAAFGSSALVGYPLIQFAFPNDPQALADAVLISELGVGLPLFTLAPLVAMHFGSRAGEAPPVSATLFGYLRSPIFIAVALGLVAAQAPLPLDGPWLAPILEALRMIEGALTIVACLILGLQLSLGSVRGAWLLIAVSATINLLFQPWCAGTLASLLGVGAEQRQVLILISAMPSAVLGAVFATRYDCAPKQATAIVFSSVLLGLVAVPAVFSSLVR
jgi:malate permease and related proteins